MDDKGRLDKGFLQIGGHGEGAEAASWREMGYTCLGMRTVNGRECSTSDSVGTLLSTGSVQQGDILGLL